MAAFEELNLAELTAVQNPIYSNSEHPKNKFIFFKQNNQMSLQGPRILVNPHFKDNIKVFINPKFQVVPPAQPNIYINPNIIKQTTLFQKLPTVSTSSINSISRCPLKTIHTDNKGSILVSTKNKLIKIHKTSNNELKTVDAVLSRSSDTCEKLNLNYTSNVDKNETKKILSTQMKIVNIPTGNQSKMNGSLRRNSFLTRFKYIKNKKSVRKVHKVVKSRHKIINKVSTSNCKNIEVKIVSRKIMPNSRKKYVYVNKYNSSSFLANNVILKNTRRKSFINVNGIFYQNSPNVMKRAQTLVKQQRPSKNISLTRSINRAFVSKNIPPKLKRNSLLDTCKRQRGQYKLIRPQIASASKLKKCNISCKIYKKYGRCNGQKNGTCIKVHNPDQIVLCTKFLQGACIKKNCLLSHKVSPEKMPTCKYYLEGLCSKDDCQYLHVKISPKAEICKNFLEGFCQNGIECNKRHQFLCPDFEKTQTCTKKTCEYPHLKHTRNSLPKLENKIFRKSTKNKEPKAKKYNFNEIKKLDLPKVRYYEEDVECGIESKGNLISKRPKLGSLPTFIPLSGET